MDESDIEVLSLSSDVEEISVLPDVEEIENANMNTASTLLALRQSK